MLNSLEVLPPGTRFVNNELTIHLEAIQEDETKPPDETTAIVLRSIANSIMPMIKMEEDFPSNHPSGKLPILDLEVWIEDGEVRHHFYKKRMANRKLVQAKSAFSVAKRSILVEEGMRRLRNCSPELSWAEKISFLNRFSSDMRYSGHGESFRLTVLKRVIGRYQAELSNHLEGRKKMFRSREERELDTEQKRCKSQKDKWFRSGGATSTLTVPVSPNGELAEKMRTNLLRGSQPKGTMTKVVEDCGRSSRSGLVRTNQFCRQECGRNDCVLCFQKEGNKSAKCMVSNVGYEGRCSCCTTRFSYIGRQPGLLMPERGEHLSDYRSVAAAQLPPLTPDEGWALDGRKKDVKSFMWEHSRDWHGVRVMEGWF